MEPISWAVGVLSTVAGAAIIRWGFPAIDRRLAARREERRLRKIYPDLPTALRRDITRATRRRLAEGVTKDVLKARLTRFGLWNRPDPELHTEPADLALALKATILAEDDSPEAFMAAVKQLSPWPPWRMKVLPAAPLGPAPNMSDLRRLGT